MTKQTAIAKIRSIQTGSFDRNCRPCPRGEVAKQLWDDVTFSYGMEYGAILVLMEMFDIDDDEL